MVTIEVNGVRVECDDAKAARKALRDAEKRAAKEQAERDRCYGAARTQAESKAYRILWHKAKHEAMPRGWRLYEEHEPYAKGLFSALPVEFGYGWKHEIECECGRVALEHYGSTLVGVVCNGAGYALALVLHDNTTHEETVFAVGADGGHIALADVPGVVADEFRKRQD